MTILLAGFLHGRGGVQTHLEWLSRALASAGHAVHLASFSPPPNPDEHDRVKTLLEDGVASIEFLEPAKGQGKLGKRAACFGALLRLIRAVKADALIACGTGWNLFLPAIAAAQPRRCFHEVTSGVAFGWKDSRWAARLGFHEVVAQAGPVANNFSRTFGWKHAIPVLPAFAEPLEITGQLPSGQQHGVSLGSARAAFFSRLVPHKGALWLVNQWPRLSKCLRELHIYGSGPEAQPIQALISSKGWGDRVFCHGPYPTGQDYINLLAQFDLTLLPTTGAEGAPLVLLESMACAVPFVAFGVGGIPDYTNPDSEIVSEQPLENFIAAVETLTHRLDRGDVDHARLQNFYQERFSFDALKRRWLDWLES